MRLDHCEFEESVVQSGQFTSDLQAHFDRCEICQEAWLVAKFLSTLPQTRWTDLPLPSPESIWWRGQIAQKRELAARSVAAINIVQKIAGALIAILIAAFAISWTPQLLNGSSDTAYLSVATILFLAGSILVLYAWATERI